MKKQTKKTPKARRNRAEKKLREGERLAIKGALVGTVTATELAEIAGYSDERLRQFAAEGMPKASRGRYPLRDAARFMFDKLRGRQEAERASGPTRSDLDRELLLIKVRKAQGEVFDRREVMDAATGAFTRLGAELEAFATRLGRELNLTGDDVRVARDLLDETRNKFARDMGEYIEVTEAGENEPVAKTA